MLKKTMADFRSKTAKGLNFKNVEFPFIHLLSVLTFLSHRRNAILEKMGAKLPTARKTGTTIAGIVFKVRFDLPVIEYFALISDRFVRD